MKAVTASRLLVACLLGFPGTAAGQGFSLPPSWVVDADLSQPGFRVRTHQVELYVPNRIQRAEDQLADRWVDHATGIPETNVANTSDFGTDGYYTEDTYINYNQDALGRFDPSSHEGFYGANAPTWEGQRLEHPIPGIPGWYGSNDYFAQEILTYLVLQEGYYYMTVNSDDGFKVTATRGDPRDELAQIVGMFDGGRAAADTTFGLYVAASGAYAFRLLWFEGSGGANVEWSVQKAGENERLLINDPYATNAVKAYRSSVNEYAYARRVVPSPGAVGVPANTDILVELVDATGEAVDPSSLQLMVDGTEQTPLDVVKQGRITSIRWHNPATLPPWTNFLAEGTRLAEITYDFLPGGLLHNARTQGGHISPHGTGGPIKHHWEFDVAAFETLSTKLCRTNTGQIPGFNYRLHQVSPQEQPAATIQGAEDLLEGSLSLANLAAEPEGAIVGSPVNLNQTETRAGNFSGDDTVPGLTTDQSSVASMDHFAMEISAFVSFPSSGFYVMGVTSDDGFEVSTGRLGERNAAVLSAVDESRAAEATIFGFLVLEPGLYPIRLLWFENTGDASLEWFTIQDIDTWVLLNDTDHGGLSVYRTVTSESPPVDAPPTLDPIPGQPRINHNAGVQTVSLTGITAGGGESQELVVAATSSNPAIIPDPAVSYTSPQSTGILTYVPTPNTGGNVEITVTVSETNVLGIPLSTTRSFHVFVVAPAPSIILESLSVDSAGFRFSWDARAGEQFRVQSRDQCAAGANWQDVAGMQFITATGNTASAQCPVEASPRFFRVVRLE